MNAKKVKKTVRNRLRWSEEQWGRNVDQCCLFIWAVKQCKADAKVFGFMHQISNWFVLIDCVLVVFVFWASCVANIHFQGYRWHVGSHESELCPWESWMANSFFNVVMFFCGYDIFGTC